MVLHGFTSFTQQKYWSFEEAQQLRIESLGKKNGGLTKQNGISVTTYGKFIKIHQHIGGSPPNMESVQSNPAIIEWGV